jgi:hypothetical protein
MSSNELTDEEIFLRCFVTMLTHKGHGLSLVGREKSVSDVVTAQPGKWFRLLADIKYDRPKNKFPTFDSKQVMLSLLNEDEINE